MSVARVVEFSGVSKERADEMREEMKDREPPEGMPSSEVAILHDPEGEKALVVIFFESAEDYQKADEALQAMPAEDTPGQRTGFTRYEVVARRTT